MALTRTELLARGLVRAQELTGKDVPIVTLLDNPNISSLSPEEKVEIIKRYSELTGHDSEFQGTPLYKEVLRGAKYGAGLSIPFGMMAGKFTAPPPSVIKETWKAGKEPMMEMAKRVGKPVGKVLMLGGMVGATAGLLQGLAKNNTNRYLSAISNNIANSTDEEDKRITAAALLTATPHLSAGFRNTSDIMRAHVSGQLPHTIESLKREELGDHYYVTIPNHPDAFPESVRSDYLNSPENTAIVDHSTGDVAGYNLKIQHDDWNYVKGIQGKGKVGWTTHGKNK